jgi:transposase
MIGPTGAVRVLVATKPVDFRKGAEGLAALVRETMKANPFSGAVYVFRAKRADRVKLIYWDGTGVCLFAKRLEDGKFRWPSTQDGVMRLSAAELSACWKGWIGSGFTQRGRHRRHCSRGDCGRVNQSDGRARDVARCVV